MTIWIREFKEEDFVQVYKKSDLWNGWKIIYQGYGIEDFNKNKRHKFSSK